MKIAVTFTKGFGLAAVMCALAFGYIAFTTHHPELMIYFDHDHLPMSALAAVGACFAFAVVWTVLASLRAKT